jgi:hypothetical protein
MSRSADFGDLPIGMAISAAQRLHTADSLGFYVRQKGDPDRGLVILYFEDENTLLTQERDYETDRLIWRETALLRPDAGDHLSRLAANDPDAWIIEIDGSLEKNPFTRLG